MSYSRLCEILLYHSTLQSLSAEVKLLEQSELSKGVASIAIVLVSIILQSASKFSSRYTAKLSTMHASLTLST